MKKLKHIQLFETHSSIVNNKSGRDNDMLDRYLETAIWDLGLEGERFVSDFTEDAIDQAEKDCEGFWDKVNPLFVNALDGHFFSDLGHYFWLSRNGKIGFNYAEHAFGDILATKLHEISKEFNPVEVKNIKKGTMEYLIFSDKKKVFENNETVDESPSPINTLKKFLNITGFKRHTNHPSLRELKAKMREHNIDKDLEMDIISFFLYEDSENDYVVYHRKYGSTIDEVGRYIKDMGYDYNEEEITNTYIDGFFKPKPGKYKKDSITLFKNYKEQKKMLQVQIYNRGEAGFELNMYIN